MHSVGILPSEEMEHSISASSVICAHIIPSGKHEPQRDKGTSAGVPQSELESFGGSRGRWMRCQKKRAKHSYEHLTLSLYYC